jgi:hypothetical protein
MNLSEEEEEEETLKKLQPFPNSPRIKFSHPHSNGAN